MINQIQEVNFGPGTQNDYATLSNATVSLSEMGDRIITTQVKIDGDVVPNFDGWELRFRGERFVLNVKDPQAMKDNSTVNSVVSLTFYSWAIEQLKRYFFFTVPATATDVITADQYNAPVSMNIQDFGSLLNQVLTSYFHGKISASVYSGTTSDVASVEINYSKIWDVMQKIFELYGVRWRIEYDSDLDSYTVMIGYPAQEIDDHEFEYGFHGGLLRFERQVQSSDITNILLGRGGTKNVPYRYFKKADPQNPEWTADTDAIPELANLYMDRIRDANFRWYIRGWVKNENRDTSGDEGYTLPDYDDADVPPEFLWAYQKGRYTDETFDPVEYVKDDESILKYGEHWGHRDDDDEIYPTIQGMMVGGARADLVVAVSEITTDNIQATTEAAANIVDLSNGVVNQTNDIEPNRTGMDLQYEEIYGDTFTVPTGMIANLKYNDFFITADAQRHTLVLLDVVEKESRVVAVRESDGAEISPEGLTAGTYHYIIYVAIENTNSFAVNNATYGVNGLRLEQSAAGSSDAWLPTFDIWIRNIFNSGRGVSETPEEYALRVWGPILGDRLGNEAAVAFSDGQMSISEDYTFKIASYPEWDNSKTLNGQQSEWKLTLYKTDAEFEATGLYVPNATTGGRPIAGDHFYFLGIDMPQFYVEKAEERVTNEKNLAFYGISDINPTWVVSLDQVRMDQEYNDEQERLFDKIEAGVKMFVYDKRFSNGATLALFASSVTFTWSDDTIILPTVEVVLTDKIAVTKSQIAEIRGDINNLKSSIAQMSGVENLVRETVKPLFLAKTGEEQTSLSPTKFTSLVTSEDFKQGGFGGSGWGFYRDNTKAYQDLEADAEPVTRSAPLLRSGEGESESEESEGSGNVQATPSVRAGSQAVLEIDKLIVRREMHVNSLVVNQIAYVGGKQIVSAAAMECVQVVDGNGYYDCYFDQKQGSVKNLFKVNDIALGQVFTADNLQLRFYKCVVTQVGLDYIRLSKTQKYGSGVPAKGDVIVQFGNTIDKDRQYAIIRDVIGGGYEQMLSDLDSIYNNGVEYYFAGLKAEVTGDYEDLADSQDELLATKSPDEDKVLAVMTSPKPRFFVGTADSHIDFTTKDGIMRLKGNIVQSPSGVEFPVPCWRGEYSADEWYYYGDLVIYNASNWIHIGKERTKGTTPATGNVWRLYTESRPIAYGDLDNEMDAIGVGEDGILDVAIPKSNALTTTFRIYYGTTSMPLTALTVSGVPNGISYERVQSNGVYTGQIKFWAPTVPVDLSAGRYAITISGSASINNQTVTYDAVYTLMGARQGIDGATFILVPNINAVKKTAAGVISDAYITCDATDSTGTQLTTFYIYYSKDGGTKALYKQRVDGGSVTYGTGLSSGIPTNDMTTNVKLYLYLTSSDVTNDKYIDTETIPMIVDGDAGTNGVAVFRWNQSATEAPSISGTAYPPTNWSKTAPSRPTTPGEHYLWMSTGNQVSASAVDAWSTPVRISGDKGTAGEDAADLEWIYYRNSEASYGTAPASITKDKDGVQRDAAYIASHDDFVPYGWTDNPQGVTSVYKFEYAAFREKDRGASTWGAFSTPILWSHYGERGIDGDGIEYVYIRTNSATAPTITNSDDTYDGKTYVDDDYRPLSSAGRCTDDPTGVDSTHMYEWVAMRTKGAPSTTLGSEGVRTWNKYSGTMALWAKYGEKGSTGRVMRGLREWTSGTAYQGYNDNFDASTENIFYDVVWIPDPNDSTQKLYFYCKTGHTASSTNKPVSGGNTYWASANQFDFVATKVFLAQNAQIDFLTGNDIMVKDANGNVVAGMLGGTGVNFFAGPGSGNTWKDKAANARFWVDNSGNVGVNGQIQASGSAFSGSDADPDNPSQTITHSVAIQSNNGLRVIGDSFFHGSIVANDAVSGSTNSSQLIQSSKGTYSAKLSIGANSSGSLALIKSVDTSKSASVETYNTGTVKLISEDSDSDPHYVELYLFGGNATIARGTSSSASAENIISCPTGDYIKHIRKMSESDYNNLSTAQKNDATILYFLT